MLTLQRSLPKDDLLKAVFQKIIFQRIMSTHKKQTKRAILTSKTVHPHSHSRTLEKMGQKMLQMGLHGWKALPGAPATHCLKEPLPPSPSLHVLLRPAQLFTVKLSLSSVLTLACESSGPTTGADPQDCPGSPAGHLAGSCPPPPMVLETHDWGPNPPQPLLHHPRAIWHIWIHPESSDWWGRVVLAKGDDMRWLQNFPMKRHLHGALQLAHPHPPVPELLDVASPLCGEVHGLGLWKLTTLDSYHSVGQQFEVGKSTTGAVIFEVMTANNQVLLGRFVNIRDLDSAVAGFTTLNFPQCFGAIDGVHFAIRAPHHSAGCYVNHQGYPLRRAPDIGGPSGMVHGYLCGLARLGA
ncbi:uncharacterized protein LOC142018157 [Carettochelys insculpta]|uniref:uncharacterized protein LOC142018157 n=1 Tax=Carettochelys insculpta TaxID=44489 RepID=UPI003EBDEE4F